MDRGAEDGLAHDDPWQGLVDYARAVIAFGGGSLGSLAGTIRVTDAMARDNWVDDARNARDRSIAIALDGLRVCPAKLPHSAPAEDLLTRRWSDPEE